MAGKFKYQTAPRKRGGEEIEDVFFREVNINYVRSLNTPIITSPLGVSAFLREVAPNNSQEHLLALYLDGAHQPIGFSVIATGSAAGCSFHPRDVFQRAVMLGAFSIILAHNHPSGSLQVSREDRAATERLRKAGTILGIKVLDHIIFTDDGHLSFYESGEMESKRSQLINEHLIK